jgi:hypothetical protein
MEANSPTNATYNKETAKRLSVERSFLYQPSTEWTYSHHPHITHFNDRFYAIWSNGHVNEDDVGQRVLISRSSDFITWSDPMPLLDSQPGKHNELVLTAAGFHKYEDFMVAYIGQYEYEPECVKNGARLPDDSDHMDTLLRAMVTLDGMTWQGPISMRIPIVPNHGPQPTSSGRLIISGNISFPYTDDPTGLSGWKMTGIYPAEMASDIVDDSESFHLVQEEAEWPVGLCEGSFFETDDQVLHMLLRSNVDKLWITESTDDGTTWSEPLETNFTDNATKFHFGRLPDGRFYYVGCPDPTPDYQRSPLVLSLSKDGISFDQHYILADQPYKQLSQGLYKGGEYGYPHTLLHDNALHIIISRQKEGVEVLRVQLSELQ